MELKPKFVVDAKADAVAEDHQLPHNAAKAHHGKAEKHEESHHDEGKEKKKQAASQDSVAKVVEVAESHSMPQRNDESNDDDGNEEVDDNENDSTNNDEDNYDEFQARVETKSTPNGTVTTYTE